MKRLLLVLVLSLVVINSSKALDGEFWDNIQKDKPNISTSDFKKFCSRSENYEFCYAYIRGLVWGYTRGFIAAQNGRENLCIPEYEQTTIHELTLDIIVIISEDRLGDFGVFGSGGMDFHTIEKILTNPTFCDEPHY